MTVYKELIRGLTGLPNWEIQSWRLQGLEKQVPYKSLQINHWSSGRLPRLGFLVLEALGLEVVLFYIEVEQEISRVVTGLRDWKI